MVPLMKNILFVVFALAAGSAFAENLPLRNGQSFSFDLTGSTRVSSARDAVVEIERLGARTVMDLYERTAHGVAHSQYVKEGNGHPVLVREKAIGPDETVGLFVGRELSEEGREALGLNLPALFGGKSETPDERDARLGPWLDLKGGGISTGPAQTQSVKKPDGNEENIYGSLLNGTVLPERGQAFERIGRDRSNWSTGYMISMIEGAAREMTHLYPKNIVQVGGISKEGGGFFPPHKSHQNGLDADIAYMGVDGFDSQVGKDGKVLESFDSAKNWDFFRAVMSQRIFDQNKEQSAVSMILVGPALKKHFCAWAKNLKEPLDQEILRKMRPTEGHDNHIHLRLKCSPHHAMCLRQNYEPKSTGCEAPST